MSKSSYEKFDTTIRTMYGRTRTDGQIQCFAAGAPQNVQSISQTLAARPLSLTICIISEICRKIVHRDFELDRVTCVFTIESCQPILEALITARAFCRLCVIRQPSQGDEVWFEACQCKQSSTPPFCDRTHNSLETGASLTLL